LSQIGLVKALLFDRTVKCTYFNKEFKKKTPGFCPFFQSDGEAEDIAAFGNAWQSIFGKVH